MARVDDGHTTVLRSGKPRGGAEGPVLERSGRVVDEDSVCTGRYEVLLEVDCSSFVFILFTGILLWPQRVRLSPPHDYQPVG